MAERKTQKKSSTNDTLTSPKKLKLLVTVVERQKTEFYIDILEQFDINLQSVLYGKGTAPSTLEYLGLSDQNKAIIFSLVPESKIKKIVETLNEKFEKVKHGKGIAYTIPLDSVIGVFAYSFLTNNSQIMERGE